MLEYLKQLDPLLMVLLGWLFGLWTPTVAERIRRPYRRRDLMRAVVDEMRDFQHTMATVALQVRERSGSMSDAFLDEILPIIEGHAGLDRNEGLLEAMKAIRKCSETERAAVSQATGKSKVGLTLPQYALPLFITQIADLTICEIEFQRSVLHIRKHLDLYNQIGPYTQLLLQKSFDKSTPQDLEAIETNREVAWRDAGKRAEIIVRAIRDLQKRYGDPK